MTLADHNSAGFSSELEKLTGLANDSSKMSIVQGVSLSKHVFPIAERC